LAALDASMMARAVSKEMGGEEGEESRGGEGGRDDLGKSSSFSSQPSFARTCSKVKVG
jgi:hypothetical protein